MEHRKYEIYKMYLSFENDINDIEKHINEIPTQTNGGHSKIGYMSEELRELKEDLILITSKYRNKIEKKKKSL